MSQPDSQKDDDVEIDVGRYVRRVLARWWIVAISVVVVVGVALVTQTGSSSETWTARTLVFLGQPLSASGSPLNITLGSNPATPGILIKNDQLLARAAQQAGLKPGALKGHVSSQVLAAAITKANYTPLVNIVVQGLAKDKVAPASKAVADEIVTAINRYPNAQQKAYLTAFAKSQKTILANANQRLKIGTAQLNRIQQLKGIDALSTRDPHRERHLESERHHARRSPRSRTATPRPCRSWLRWRAASPRAQIVENPRAVRSTATSGGANIGVAVILGLVIGIVLALASYVVRPVRRVGRLTAKGPHPLSSTALRASTRHR